MIVTAQFSVPIDTIILQARKKYQVDSSNILRKLALDIYAEIIRNTPVDTGRARANWNLSINRPNFAKSTSTVPSTVNISASTLRNLPDIYIANGLPYVRDLEFGRSDQAPNGFIRLAIQRVQNRGI
jgi:hypothetical protein